MHLWPTNLSAIFLRAFRAGKNLGQTVEKQVFGNAYSVPNADIRPFMASMSAN